MYSRVMGNGSIMFFVASQEWYKVNLSIYSVHVHVQKALNLCCAHVYCMNSLRGEWTTECVCMLIKLFVCNGINSRFWLKLKVRHSFD